MEFVAKRSREPTFWLDKVCIDHPIFWLDKVCIDQLDIADGLRMFANLIIFWLDKVCIDQLNIADGFTC